MEVKCHYCNSEIQKSLGEINRANKHKYNVFCNKICSGLYKRTKKSNEQLKKEKQLYDKQYRSKNKKLIKVKKALYFRMDYAEKPEKYKQIRKNGQQSHNEYCRQPQYKKWKKEYDQKYRAKNKYGDFWESSIIINNISLEIDKRQANIDNNTYNKSQKRKRKINY